MQALSALNQTGPKCWIEDLDIRAPMAICVLTSLSSIGLSNTVAIAIVWAVSFLYFLSLKRIKTVVMSYLAMAGMTAMAVICVMILLFFFPALGEKLTAMTLVIPCVRICILLNVILPLALTCRVNRMLSALESMHLPFFLFLPMAVIIRFIPTFSNDIQQVWEALKIRGVRPSVANFLRHPVMMMRLLVAPVIFRSLKTAEQLGIAAELKGISAQTKGQAPMESTWSNNDTLVVSVAVITLVLAFSYQIFVG
jgi:energy-coupling factor transport system permease protein